MGEVGCATGGPDNCVDGGDWETGAPALDRHMRLVTSGTSLLAAGFG